MSILSHLSLTMVPFVIGVMFSQTEKLREAWKKNAKGVSLYRSFFALVNLSC
jgi:hypothetical protein